MSEPTIREILHFFKNDSLKDVCNELEDPRYANRQHGSRATAALGCGGPLCRKAERDRSRKRNEARAISAGRIYRGGERSYDRDDLLEAIIEWHKAKLASLRAGVLSA